ncbi:hypothetical protein XM38_007700 [Halomicronema hongdechloris C2206]|uniref:Uncharacterized protein n=1 Tax=Halomicronema hongdechloris C2206 TaxID=1641165 RepID=A0A1Z3HHT5_9CYAN|nr:hypothetical protein [Halomicronema hongdechloris]ASC69840.1 hypothetical protein XM38_007700 [Halomicronema hongdechloris C2206]
MAALARSHKIPRRRRTKWLWFERLMALIALVNLALVLFDLSYIRFRDFYLKFVPELTEWYGATYKGIQPERSTVTYLETVDRLEEQVAQTGLQSRQATILLNQLQQQSIELIDENPFQVANKSGTLERIKNMMRDRIGTDSAKVAFRTFWSQDHLSQNPWSEEIDFFNDDIKPLMQTNYFRRIGIDGLPLDWFWQIDGWFILVFGLELAARSFYLCRHYKNVTWLDALLWRWYDLLMVLPFSAVRMPVLGLSRTITVAIRLDQSQLIDLQPLRNRINRFFISQVAIELTEVVILRIIDQCQNLIRAGDVTRWLVDAGTGRRYIDINGIDELQVMSQRFITILVEQVLPQIKPEIDAVLNHSLNQVLGQAPAYGGLRRLPGIGTLPDQLAQRLAAEISTNAYDALKQTLEDDQGAVLIRSLVAKLTDRLRHEVQQDDTLDEFESLTVALLEEVKLNYVRRLAAEDIEQLMEERYRLYNVTQEGRASSN